MHPPDARGLSIFIRHEQLQLLNTALEGRTQAELAAMLGIAERTLRCYKAHPGGQFVSMPYAIRYCLEAIVESDARGNRSKSREHGGRRVRAVRR